MTSLAIAGVILFHYVNVPMAEMREGPSEETEIASSAIFSEEVNVLQTYGDWVHIETLVDRYKGWVKKDVLCHRPDEYLKNSDSLIAKVNRLAAHLYAKADVSYGPMMVLPFESRLQILEPEALQFNSRWIKVAMPDRTSSYIQRGDVILGDKKLSLDEMLELSLRFLNLPYTWGGRSSFGYDCSGFVQMLYRQMGILLPRDSRDQVGWIGFREISLDKLEQGDLIFFGLDSDKIKHVGMYLGNGSFIHASTSENLPWIRISHLTDSNWNGSGTLKYRTARTLK